MTREEQNARPQEGTPFRTNREPHAGQSEDQAAVYRHIDGQKQQQDRCSIRRMRPPGQCFPAQKHHLCQANYLPAAASSSLGTLLFDCSRPDVAIDRRHAAQQRGVSTDANPDCAIRGAAHGLCSLAGAAADHRRNRRHPPRPPPPAAADDADPADDATPAPNVRTAAQLAKLMSSNATGCAPGARCIRVTSSGRPSPSGASVAQCRGELADFIVPRTTLSAGYAGPWFQPNLIENAHTGIPSGTRPWRNHDPRNASQRLAYLLALRNYAFASEPVRSLTPQLTADSDYFDTIGGTVPANQRGQKWYPAPRMIYGNLNSSGSGRPHTA